MALCLLYVCHYGPLEKIFFAHPGFISFFAENNANEYGESEQKQSELQSEVIILCGFITSSDPFRIQAAII